MMSKNMAYTPFCFDLKSMRFEHVKFYNATHNRYAPRTAFACGGAAGFTHSLFKASPGDFLGGADPSSSGVMRQVKPVLRGKKTCTQVITPYGSFGGLS